MIRRSTPGDVDAVMDLFVASTVPGQSFLPEAFWLDQAREIREELLPRAETWVVDDGAGIVAFTSLHDDLIGGLFTHPDHQGQGHGRALVEHAHARIDPLLVEVFEANERALGFYRRCGFVDHDRAVDEASGLPLVILRLGGAATT